MMIELSDSVNKDKKPVINPSHTNVIDYNSRSFLKGLAKVNKKAEQSNEMSIPDNEKKYLSYSIN